MIDITKLEEISSKLIYNENHKELINIETFLYSELNNAEDVMEKEYVLFLYLVAKIKNNPVETESISLYFQNYFTLIEQTAVDLEDMKDLKIMYIWNVISHLQYLQKLYSDKFFWKSEEKIYIIKNDFKRELYFLQSEYFNYIKQTLYKYILWYGRSYFNLMYSSMVTWFLFAFIYYLNDIKLDTWTLYWSFVGWEGHIVGPFDYYLYLSLSTLSNLWADFWLGTSLFLRIIFWIEQMLWVVLTWLFIYILAKKL